MEETRSLKKTLLHWVSDIRFWIVFYFTIRLIGITNAPLEVDHNWRQSLTNMTARNFVEEGADLFHPKIDMAGNRTGIIGSEFPIFNYLIFLVSKIFGYAHWYGRLINLIISSLGIWFFYKLVAKISSKQIAFTSTLLFLSSLWFMFSRKSMPDTFSVSLMIIGIYHIHAYLFENKNTSLLWAFLLCTLGGLSKIPAVSLLAFLPLVLFSRQTSTSRKTILYGTLFLSALCICSWYFIWVPYLVETYRFQLYFPKGIVEGWNEIYPLLGGFFKKFYFSALSSYLAFAAFIIGCYFFVRKTSKEMLLSIALITTTFLVFILKTGAVFPLHNYYVLPFVPVMALVAAYSIVELKSKWQTLVLVGISIEALANQQHDFFIKPKELYKLEIENTIAPFVPKEAKVIVNGGPSPQDMYFTHRKGWSYNNVELTSERLDSLQKEGAQFLIFNKHSKPKVSILETKIFENEHLIVFKLDTLVH
jgi:hypothetical protein